MPEQFEMLLEEIAILRNDVAQIQAALARSEETFRSTQAALLERLVTLTELVMSIEKKLPTLAH